MLIVRLDPVINFDHVYLPVEHRLSPDLLQCPRSATPLTCKHLILNRLPPVFHHPHEHMPLPIVYSFLLLRHVILILRVGDHDVALRTVQHASLYFEDV